MPVCSKIYDRCKKCPSFYNIFSSTVWRWFRWQKWDLPSENWELRLTSCPVAIFMALTDTFTYKEIVKKKIQRKCGSAENTCVDNEKSFVFLFCLHLLFFLAMLSFVWTMILGLVMRYALGDFCLQCFVLFVCKGRGADILFFVKISHLAVSRCCGLFEMDSFSWESLLAFFNYPTTSWLCLFQLKSVDQVFSNKSDSKTLWAYVLVDLQTILCNMTFWDFSRKWRQNNTLNFCLLITQRPQSNLK